jgi:hypothetical protein
MDVFGYCSLHMAEKRDEPTTFDHPLSACSLLGDDAGANNGDPIAKVLLLV